MEIDAHVVNESAHRRRPCEWIVTVGTVSGPSAAARSAVGARGDEVGSATARSGGATFVAMVHAADLRDGHDGGPTRWHDRPRNWRVCVQRQVCPGPFVIRAVAGHQPADARLVEDDHVIETLTSRGSDKPLDDGMLPRCVWSRADVVGAHRRGRGPDVVERMITIVIT